MNNLYLVSIKNTFPTKYSLTNINIFSAYTNIFKLYFYKLKKILNRKHRKKNCLKFECAKVGRSSEFHLAPISHSLEVPEFKWKIILDKNLKEEY